MPDKSKFGALILSHGRPDNVQTYDLLRRRGYTGPIYIVVDDKDATAEQYVRRYGRASVVSFSKADYDGAFDIGDAQGDRRCVVYARNASCDIARSLGLDYFIELDDDYDYFAFRWVEQEDGRPRLTYAPIADLDAVLRAMVDFLEDTGALTVAMSQGGDHMGGMAGGRIGKGLMRKAMNSFVVRTERPIGFVGRINEDTNTYVVKGSRGDLFFTIMGLQLDQMDTQQRAGGLTDIYLGLGTYVKSFYTVMMAPSCTKVTTMGRNQRRYHHQVRWDHAVPKILSEKYRRVS